jgi:hypothetical protein
VEFSPQVPSRLVLKSEGDDEATCEETDGKPAEKVGVPPAVPILQ